MENPARPTPGPLRLDLGGGRRPKEGFTNVDVLDAPGVVRCDFSRERLPFADDSVAEVYSSHCLEHLDNHHHVLHEIVRVCRPGASVELRVPHWLSAMAHCAGHRCTIAPHQVQHWCQDFLHDWWQGSAKRLAHVRTEYERGPAFDEAKKLFFQMTDEQVLRFVPDACHEVRYFFEVVPYA